MNVPVIKDYMAQASENIIEFLQDMVREKSYSGEEGKMAELVQQKMKTLEYDEVKQANNGSVIGRIGSGEKVLLYDAHMDTVPAGNRENWSVDPFAGKIEDGILYGRGASDDKGALASMIYAGSAIKNLDLAENLTIYIVAPVMEEVCEGIALGELLEEENIKPDYTVIGEPSCGQLMKGHRGRALLQAVFSGKEEHASSYSKENHALYKALSFIEATFDLDENLEDDGIMGKGNICVTDVKCDSNSLNSTPEAAKVIMDRRTNSKEDREKIISELEEVFEGDSVEIKIMEREFTSYTGEKIIAEEYFPGWILEDGNTLLERGISSYQDYYEKEPEPKVWGFCTDGNMTKGHLDIPTIGCGPGNPEHCHTTHDQVDLQEVVEVAGYYTCLAENISLS